MQAMAFQLDIPGYLARLGAVCRVHRWLIAVVLFYVIAGFLVAEHFGKPEKMSVGLYIFAVPHILGIYLFLLTLLYLTYVMTVVRPARLIAYIFRDVKTRWLIAERVFGGLLAVFLLLAFFSIFSSIKALIPVLNPFAWDPALAAWDRALHGGVDAWALMHPLLGYPIATTVINFLYQCWLFIVYGMLVWQAFTLRDPRLRAQFLLSFVLVWMLIGSLAATLLSSVGPVYYGRITGLEDPFVPLMDYLKAANEVFPVWALEVQDRLWESYTQQSNYLGAGISAMPSIHVATAVLFALTTWRANRVVGWIFTVYAGLVLIGSVHLAWHYALDGYLAIVLTYLLWRAAGWWVARDRAFTTP